MGTFSCILDGVVHQIDDHLNHQLGIHIRHHHIVIYADMDMMLIFAPVNVFHSLQDHFLHDLRLLFNLHCPILNPGDRKQIFHQVDQPHGIVIDIRVQFLFLFLTDLVRTLS